MKKTIIILCVCVALLGIILLAQKRETTPGIKIVATTSQLADVARNISGTQVEQIFPAETDPHEFQLNPQHLIAINSADIVLRNGLGLDAQLDEPLQNNQRAKVITMSDYALGETNPHLWFKIDYIKSTIQDLTKELVRIAPSQKSTFETNYRKYLTELDQLATDIREQINTIPQSSRNFVSEHDAFDYYIRDYGLAFDGSVIPSSTTEAEVSAQQLASIEDVIRQNNVKAIFTEYGEPSDLLESLAESTGVKVASLYADSLGAAGSQGDTYLKMMRYNTETIVTFLK